MARVRIGESKYRPPKDRATDVEGALRPDSRRKPQRTPTANRRPATGRFFFEGSYSERQGGFHPFVEVVEVLYPWSNLVAAVDAQACGSQDFLYCGELVYGPIGV